MLNWYTFDSLQIQHVTKKSDDEENNDSEKEIITKEINFKIIRLLTQSSLIYLIFLVTTKSEVKQFLLFFLIVLICITFN